MPGSSSFNFKKTAVSIFLCILMASTSLLPMKTAFAVQTKVTTLGIDGYSRTFSYPMDVAVLKDGSLLVVDTTNYSIRRVVGNRITTFANWEQTAAHSFGESAPCAMEVNKNDEVFVVNCGQTFINRYSSSGSLLRKIPVSLLGTSGRGFDWGGGMALDIDSNVYLSDERNSVILKVDTRSETTSIYAGKTGVSGSENGTRLQATFNLPRGLAMSENGTLYVADTLSRRIRTIDSAGNVATIPRDVCQPIAVALDRDENVIIASEYFCGGKVTKIYGDPRLIETVIDDSFQTSGTVPYGLIGQPVIGVAAGAEIEILNGKTAAEDSFVFTDAKSGSLKFFDFKGKLLRKIGGPDVFGVAVASTKGPVYNGPHSIFPLNDGRVLVVDRGTLRLVSNKGEILRTMHLPWGCAEEAELSEDGVLFCPQGNYIAVRFPDGTTGEIGNRQSGFINGSASLARFNWVSGLHWHDDVLYVTEHNNHAIREIRRVGNSKEFRVEILSAGNGPVRPDFSQPKNSTVYSWPTQIASTRDGTIFLSEGGWSRMRKIDPGVNGLVHVISGNFGSWPSGLVVDGSGVVIATSERGHLSKVVSNSLLRIGGGGDLLSESTLESASFLYPRGMAIDARGELLVADSEHNVIRKVEGLNLTPNKIYDPNKISQLLRSMTDLETLRGNAPESDKVNQIQKPTKPTFSGVEFAGNTINISVNLGNSSATRPDKVYLVAPRLGISSDNPAPGTINGSEARWRLTFDRSLAGSLIPLEIVGERDGVKSESTIGSYEAPSLSELVETKAPPAPPKDFKSRIVGSYAVITVKSTSKVNALPSAGYLFSNNLGIKKNRALQGELIGNRFLFEVPIKSSMLGKRFPLVIYFKNGSGESAPLAANLSIPAPAKSQINPSVAQKPLTPVTVTCVRAGQTRTFSGNKCPPGWEQG